MLWGSSLPAQFIILKPSMAQKPILTEVKQSHTCLKSFGKN